MKDQTAKLSSEGIDWRGRNLPPLPPWPGYCRPAPRSSKIKSCGRGGPLDFEQLELKLGSGLRVLYEVEPRKRRRVLLARLHPASEQVVIVSDIENGHTPQFPQPVFDLSGVGLHCDFLGNPLPPEATSSTFSVRSRPGKGGRSLHELARRLSERQIRVLWETEPDEFKHTARRLVVFCEKCQHVWSALVCNLDGRGSSCPSCAASKASRIEEACRRYLRLVFGNAVSEAPRRDLIAELRFRFNGREVVVKRPELDIVIDKPVGRFRSIAIEVHGEQHYSRGWSGTSPQMQIAKDRAKVRACRTAKILLVEIPYTIFDDEMTLIAESIKDRLNQTVGEEFIGITAHEHALSKWSIDDFGRITEINRLQSRLKQRIDDLELEVLSPLTEVLRTSSRISYRCPNCAKIRSSAASTLLKQSGLCHPCAKIVPRKTDRSMLWKSIELWCTNQGFRLLSRFEDYHGKPLSSAKFHFLDDEGKHRAVFCFTVSRPVVERPRARSLVPPHMVSSELAARL